MNIQDTASPGLIIRPAARADLRETFLYLCQNSVERARNFVSAVEETFEQLVAMPHLGSPRQLTGSELHNLRQWPVKGFQSYLIFYRPFASSNGIEVLRVLHGSRDVVAHLSDAMQDD